MERNEKGAAGGPGGNTRRGAAGGPGGNTRRGAAM